MYTGDHQRTNEWVARLRDRVAPRACFTVEALLDVLRRDATELVVLAPGGVARRHHRVLRHALISSEARIVLAVGPCTLPTLAQELLENDRLDALIDASGAQLEATVEQVRAIDAQLRIEQAEHRASLAPDAPQDRLLQAVTRQRQLRQIADAAALVDTLLTPELHEALALGLGADGEAPDARFMGEAARLAGAIKGMQDAECAPTPIVEVLHRAGRLGSRLLCVPATLGPAPDPNLVSAAAGVLEELIGQHLALAAQDGPARQFSLRFARVAPRTGSLVVTTHHRQDAPVPRPVGDDALHRALMHHGGVHASLEIERRELRLLLTFPFEVRGEGP